MVVQRGNLADITFFWSFSCSLWKQLWNGTKNNRKSLQSEHKHSWLATAVFPLTPLVATVDALAGPASKHSSITLQALAAQAGGQQFVALQFVGVDFNKFCPTLSHMAAVGQWLISVPANVIQNVDFLCEQAALQLAFWDGTVLSLCHWIHPPGKTVPAIFIAAEFVFSWGCPPNPPTKTILANFFSALNWSFAPHIGGLPPTPPLFWRLVHTNQHTNSFAIVTLMSASFPTRSEFFKHLMTQEHFFWVVQQLHF